MENKWYTTQEIADYWGVSNQVVRDYSFLYNKRRVIKGEARSYEYKPNWGTKQINKNHTLEDILFILIYNNFGISKELIIGTSGKNNIIPIIDCKMIIAYIMFYVLRYSKTEVSIALKMETHSSAYRWLKLYDSRCLYRKQFKEKHDLIINEFKKYDLESKR